MKVLLISIVLSLTACGSEKDESPAPALAYSDSVDLKPDGITKATVGKEGCSMDITLADIEAATDTNLNAGGTDLPFAYETVDGKFYVLTEGNVTKSVQFFKQGFARVSIVCLALKFFTTSSDKDV